MFAKNFLFCVLATLLSLSSAFVQPSVLHKAASTVPREESSTSLSWAPTGVDPWMAEMMEQTNPVANIVLGVAFVSVYEIISGRAENFSKSKNEKKKGEVFQWTPSGEA